VKKWIRYTFLLPLLLFVIVLTLVARDRPTWEAQAQDERVRVLPTELTVSEPSGTDVFSLSLTTEPTATVTISLSTPSGQCYTSVPSVSLDMLSWETGVVVTVTAMDDDIADGEQTCLIVTGPTMSEDTYYHGVDPEDVTVRVLDDDTAGIVVAATNLTISEPDGSSVITLSLTSQPVADVSIGLHTSNKQCSVSPDVAVLTEIDWQSGVTATVRAVDDHEIDGEQVCWVVTEEASSLDPLYDGFDPVNLAFVVLDDDRMHYVYLPLVLAGWPPIPRPPILQPISNDGGSGSYEVTWSDVALADGYILDESTDAGFGDPTVVYSGPSTSHQVEGRGAARYYYRVKAQNEWGESGWSDTVWTDVVWEAEPNDSFEQANGPVVAGLTYHGTLPTAGDRQDYFYFWLPSAGRVELWLTQIPAGHDYNLILRDGELEAVGYSGELGSTSEHILTGILPAGKYYVQVYHLSAGGSPQPYSLRFVFG
jgi:hypothetical protein